MKREESLNEIGFLGGYKINGEFHVGVEDVENLINKIFDSFENRICKNCKHFKTTYAPTCGLGVSCGKLFGNDIVEENFGCNKFERKIK